MTKFFDVVVIGGGPAGLSGAVVLSRSRRSVLVIDAGEPRNAPAHGVHNFLSQDGMPPAELLERGRHEVRRYGGEIWSGRVVSAARAADGFAVCLADGRQVRARRLLVATGLVDELPDVPGVRERWGRDVLHCPYCHGWEVRDQTIGILATDPRAMHMALLFRQLTRDVVFVQHAAEPLAAEQAQQLAALDIRVVSGPVASLEVEDDQLQGIRLVDGTLVACQAVVVTPKFVAAADVLAGLGLSATPHPMGMGAAVAADATTGRTEIPGVWVAGNVTDLGGTVIASAAAGTLAGAQINADLVSEDAHRALEAAA
jgi:thioredoxin reductase